MSAEPSVNGTGTVEVPNVISDPATTLTARQLELIALLASGKNYQQIADAKFVSYRTVYNTLERARANVGAESMTHLCALTIEAEMIVRNGNGFVPVVDPYSAE